ncbi:carboxypeptidase-like regulatory domain-containing protein, partial [Leyella stercorea]
MAQSTRIIKGAVVDKNGNPLPGATVEATNGAESTTVDADGTF